MRQRWSLGQCATAPAASAGGGQAGGAIGDKNFPEEYILGELYQQALEAKGYKVTLKANLGSTEIIWKALKSGQIQMYPEYDGTLLVSGRRTSPRTRAVPRRLQQAKTLTWLAKHGFTMLNTTPFSDSDAHRGAASLRQRTSPEAIADLKKLGKAVKLGAAAEFATRFRRSARARTGSTAPDVQADADRTDSTRHSTTSRSTRGRVHHRWAAEERQVHGAQRHEVLFGFQNVGMVVKKSVATAEGPAFTSTINAVSALLSQKAIIALNSAVEVDKQSPAVVPSVPQGQRPGLGA